MGMKIYCQYTKAVDKKINIRIMNNISLLITFLLIIWSTKDSFSQKDKKEIKSVITQNILFDCPNPECPDYEYILRGDYLNNLLTFKDDNGTLFNELEFEVEDGTISYENPFVLTSGTPLSISLIVEINCSDLPSLVKIRGTDNGQIIFPEQTVNAVINQSENKATMDFSGIASINFPAQKIDFVELNLDWEISYWGDNWELMGSTNNKIYVTWKDSKSETPGFSTQNQEGYEHLESIFFIGCNAAQSETTEENIISAVWNHFKQQDVKDVDGNVLQYYGKWDASAESTTTLIQSEDGQCYSWVGLFLDVLKSQGIDSQGYFRYIYSAYESSSGNASATFLVKKWQFNNNPSGLFDDYINIWFLSQGFEYVNILHPNFESSLGNNIYSFTYSEVSDQQGISGQNQNNPVSDFGDHVVARVGTQIFDPSYGEHIPYDVTSQSLIYDYQSANIDGHYYQFTIENVNEQNLNMDLNGNNTLEESVMVDIWVIKPESPAYTEMVFGNEYTY